jgi:hypothetical protein
MKILAWGYLGASTETEIEIGALLKQKGRAIARPFLVL